MKKLCFLNLRLFYSDGQAWDLYQLANEAFCVSGLSALVAGASFTPHTLEMAVVSVLR